MGGQRAGPWADVLCLRHEHFPTRGYVQDLDLPLGLKIVLAVGGSLLLLQREHFEWQLLFEHNK
jgi:hypothetical protein